MVKLARAFLLIAACSYLAAQEKTDLQTGHYLGPVHTVRVEKTVINARSSEPRKFVVIDVTFDSHGRSAAVTSYKEDGSVYYKNGWDHSYDGQGREVKRLYLNADGVLTNTGVYSYRESEHTVILKQINPDGSLNHTATHIYNDAGQLIRETREYPAWGTFVDTMEYDGNGFLTQLRNYKGDELERRYVGDNDEYGNVRIWIEYKPDGTVTLLTNKALQCDDKGNIVRSENLSKEGQVHSIEKSSYVFDDHGNWIRKTTTFEGRAGGVTRTEILDRTITYY